MVGLDPVANPDVIILGCVKTKGPARAKAKDLFNFIPCRPYESGKGGFARPVIRLDQRWITPNLAMGAKATPATMRELMNLWTEIVAQVTLVSGLDLGTRLDVPLNTTQAAEAADDA